MPSINTGSLILFSFAISACAPEACEPTCPRGYTKHGDRCVLESADAAVFLHSALERELSEAGAAGRHAPAQSEAGRL